MGGKLDNAAPKDGLHSCIKVFVGRTKLDSGLTQCDPATKLVNAVSFLGPCMILNILKVSFCTEML